MDWRRGRRGGRIDDRRGEDRRFQVLERQEGMYVTPRQDDERVHRALRNRNRGDGSRVTDYGQNGRVPSRARPMSSLPGARFQTSSSPMSPMRRGLRPGTTTTMGRR